MRNEYNKQRLFFLIFASYSFTKQIINLNINLKRHKLKNEFIGSFLANTHNIRIYFWSFQRFNKGAYLFSCHCIRNLRSKTLYAICFRNSDNQVRLFTYHSTSNSPVSYTHLTLPTNREV